MNQENDYIECIYNSNCYSGCCGLDYVCDTWMSCPSHYISVIIVPIIIVICAIVGIIILIRYRNNINRRHNYQATASTSSNHQYAPQPPYPPQGYPSGPSQGYGSPQNNAGYAPPQSTPAYQNAAPS